MNYKQIWRPKGESNLFMFCGKNVVLLSNTIGCGALDHVGLRDISPYTGCPPP